jgi:heavy metal efflux system protein
MLLKLIDASIHYRWLVLFVAILISMAGVYSSFQLPLDAIPDLTNVQVQVVTKAGSLSPIEVERYVTQPLEKQLNGLPRMTEIRSISRLGISLITIVFDEGTNLYWARQVINQRLTTIDTMPNGVDPPEMGPLTTALGEVLQFEVRGSKDKFTSTELRSLLEWEISPALRTVRGVTDVNSHGGYYKSFEIRPDPERLQLMHLTLDDIAQAVTRNNRAAGGGYMIAGSQQRFIQGDALLQSLDDIRQIVLRSADEGSPVLIKDVAEVGEGALLRQGAATRDARGEVVIGMAMMLVGENPRIVVKRIKQRLAEISKTLPEGVEIEVIYDREGLINRALTTVGRNLLEGGGLVILVLFLFLGSFRAGLITALAIPLAMLFAINSMFALGISASLMSLGAIDFGLIVDSSVIMIENCMHRMDTAKPGETRETIVRDAAIEVRKPTLFGELIIAVVYLPVLMLDGSAGKLFFPMALTVLLCLLGSLIVSMTVMPALASLSLRIRKTHVDRNHVHRESYVMQFAMAIYRPILDFVLHMPMVTRMAAACLTLLAIPLALRLGGEFMPRLEEGDMLIEAVRLPSATLEDSVTMTTRIEGIVKKHPEVKTVFCKTGRPEIANDIMGVHQTDVWVMLHPKEQWPRGVTRETLIERFSKELESSVPGAVFGFTQPIEMRVDELVAGVKADVAVLIYGDDLSELSRIAKEVANALQKIEGRADVKPDIQANLSTLRIEVDRAALARYGVDASVILQTVESLGQLECGTAYLGRARFPIVIRLPEEYRNNIDRIRMMPLATRQGQTIPLKDVAIIENRDTPPAIEHEWNRRRTFVSSNVRGRDVASFVNEAKALVAKEIQLPDGYEIRWGGDFESLQNASLRLSLITPLVLLLIGVLLYLTFHSVSLTLLVFVAIPVAASGGVYALAWRGMPFSISAGVGFIALFGVAVLNSLVWVSAAEHRRLAGESMEEVVRGTALSRLRAILMTAFVAAFGFIPMAFSHGDGAEIQRPLASVVIGGIITSTMLSTIVLPVLYPWFVTGSRRSTDKGSIKVA